MNILWIMTDQHRADCNGFMKHPLVQTPNLDKLAESGVVFENAFCQSPVCMASRASVFTGRYPGTVRVRGMGILPSSETTFPEVLQRHGFKTAAFGKIHFTPEQYTLQKLKSDRPILDLRQFSEDGMLGPITDDPFKKNYGFEIHKGCEDILQGNFFDWLSKKNPELLEQKEKMVIPEGPSDLWISPYPSELHPSSFIANSAEEFIRDQDGSKPWFSYCSFIAPHHPFEAPIDQISRYDIESMPLPEFKGGVDPAFIPYPAVNAIGEIQQYSEDIQRRIQLHYFASISLIDDCVGKLMTALKQTGQMENTLIIFTSDHGEFLGNHSLLRKPSIHYDETLRVPLMIRMAGKDITPRRVQGMVELTDVFPTLLGLLDVPLTPGVQGIDWSSAMHSGEQIGREDIYSDMFDMFPMRFGTRVGPYMAVQTLRTEKWKLNIYPAAGQKYGQLFDLENDPDESCNLYAEEQYRDAREHMLWRLVSRCHTNTDPMPPYLTQY